MSNQARKEYDMFTAMGGVLIFVSLIAIIISGIKAVTNVKRPSGAEKPKTEKVLNLQLNSSWQPSEAQLEALESEIAYARQHPERSASLPELESLYWDLKQQAQINKNKK